MYTRVVTMERGPKKIKLVGCVHIAPQEYFDKIQHELNEGLVLFESTSSKNAEKSELENLKNIYKTFGEITGMQFQKDALDYSNPEWINSDLSIEILEMSNEKFKIMNGEKMSRAIEHLESLDYETREKFAKIFKKFLNIMPIMKYIVPMKLGPSIIGLRNDKVIIDTFEQMVDHDFITIAYGEGHLNDFIKKFKKFKFKVTETRRVMVNG